ncbi:uncharacterized protein LOC127788871 [Diospyros lotus]|uniref:uncharacterized protein LOC127788871 n=1 Tax=Diospyros lotus TaxID=55363 RepID=UPI00225C1AAC|nr:uncharacterized protein LOC127788871 [Diospyros lotus]
MGVILYLDTILVPLSLFLTIAYHAFLWHSFKNKPFQTTIGMNTMKRRVWLRELEQGDDKKGMLAVQSLRNTLMFTILTASLSIIMALSMAALANNAFNASSLFRSGFFGSQSGRIMVLKYGSATLFLLISFLCSSMAVSSLVDANFLINAAGDDKFSQGHGHVQQVLERGFLLAVVGNRVLCVTFPLLLWLLGPVPVALASVALIWGLYELDFAGKFLKNCKQKSQLIIAELFLNCNYKNVVNYNQTPSCL